MTGVYWDMHKQRWAAQMRVKGRKIVKRFRAMEDAIKERKAMEDFYGVKAIPARRR